MHALNRSRKRWIMLAMMTALLFTAINQTIISMALPSIMQEMGKLDKLSWIFSVYILAASVPAILVGRLSDHYGRKPFILLGIAIFIIGAWFAGFATTAEALIGARLVQGVGAGAIIVTAFTSVADLYAPSERGPWQGALGSVFALASLVGPVLGGYIVDHAHWSWVFWSSIPLGLVALFLIAWLLPAKAGQSSCDLDILGAGLLLLLMILLLLGMNQDEGWQVYLGTGLMAFYLFLKVERSAQQPILPLNLFRNRPFTHSNLVVFMLGAGIFSAMLYIPLFLQSVMSMSATAAGHRMMIMTLALVGASLLIGQLLKGRGGDKPIALAGIGLITLGLYLISTLHADSAPSHATTALIIIGLGIGTGMPVFNLGVQNSVKREQLGLATATGQLSRQLGGTLGVAMMGSLFGPTMHSVNGHLARGEVLGLWLSHVFILATALTLLAFMMVALYQARD